MEINPIKIGRGSSWSSKGARLFWIIFCLLLMIGMPLYLWFTYSHQEVTNDLGSLLFFEIFVGFLLVVFGFLPKVDSNWGEKK